MENAFKIASTLDNCNLDLDRAMELICLCLEETADKPNGEHYLDYLRRGLVEAAACAALNFIEKFRDAIKTSSEALYTDAKAQKSKIEEVQCEADIC